MNKRILIGTPCGGGVATTQYMLSLINTMQGGLMLRQKAAQSANMCAQDTFNETNDVEKAQQASSDILAQATTYDIGVYTLANESLLPRGRNHMAQVAMTQGWDKMFFIDADAGWTFNQFQAIVDSDKLISAGVCPLKIYPISLNYMPFKDDQHYYKDAGRSVESLKSMKRGHGTSEINVPFVGTAFMCIDTKVFKKLAEVTPSYAYPNPMSGQNETHWDFFNAAPVEGEYMSEDWGFCALARRNGFDVSINADVCITHTGSHTFQVTL